MTLSSSNLTFSYSNPPFAKSAFLPSRHCRFTDLISPTSITRVRSSLLFRRLDLSFFQVNAAMPAPPDDDIFKRMFASFVARKNRNSGPAVRPPPSQPRPVYGVHTPSHNASNHRTHVIPPPQPSIIPHHTDRIAPDTLRRVATDYHGKGFNLNSSHLSGSQHPTSSAYPYRSPYTLSSSARSPNPPNHHQHFQQGPLPTQLHRSSSVPRPDLAFSRPSAFPSLFHPRPAQEAHHHGHVHSNLQGHPSYPSAAAVAGVSSGSRKHAASRSGGRSAPFAHTSRGSKGSKGSKGSDKPVSASTEDAPPRKRTRTHRLANIQRSQSAHAGSLHSSRNSKQDKIRANSRFNLPSVQTPQTHIPSSSNATSSHVAREDAGNPALSPTDPLSQKRGAKPAGVKSFPCDKCSAVFAQKGQLSRHIRRVHEKLRPHACEYCGRLFGARSDRTRHVMVRFTPNMLYSFPSYTYWVNPSCQLILRIYPFMQTSKSSNSAIYAVALFLVYVACFSFFFYRSFIKRWDSFHVIDVDSIFRRRRI